MKHFLKNLPKITVVALLAFCSMAAQATIYYVKPSATGTADGLSWANARGGGDLQAVINAAASGDLVWVMKGSYPLGAGMSYKMKEGVKLYGSFAGTEASLADRHIGSTSADSSRLVGNGASVIYNYFISLSTAAVLDGFFVTGGNSASGGGMVNTRFASPSISNCIFSGNSATDAGGGMFNAFNSPIISNCIFSGNTQTTSIYSTENEVGGGGMYNSNSSPIISNCIFSANVTYAGGGGMWNTSSSSPSISNCIFAGNLSVKYSGGGIFITDLSSPTINNCLFFGNKAANGGGICNSNASPTINNCTFSGNNATNDGGGIANSASPGKPNPTINNTIIWGNSSEVSIFNSNSTPTYHNTNTTNNPLFVNAPAAGTAPFTNGDYRLQSCGSPCVNVGNNSYVVGTTDLAGNVRIVGGTVDQGAYELGTVATANSSVTFNQSGTMPYAASSCQLIATVQSTGASPIAGSTTAYVWLDSTQNRGFVKRHYQITPAANATTATGTITFYATQPEFDAYNAVNAVKLPTDSSDATGITNLKIEKHGGTSSDGTGLPGTYTGSTTTITPSAVVYNATNGRWEITFSVTGFSGFFITSTNNITLPLTWLSVTAGLNNQQLAIINWQTSDNNVASYELQKSSDARSFITFGTIASKGNGFNNYSYTDATTLNGTMYYRIKEVDKNGNTSYSGIVKVSANPLADNLGVYPNPTSGNTTINSGTHLLNSAAQLFDMNGKLLQNIPISSLSFTIDMSRYTNGIYILHASNGKMLKIVKE